MVPCALAKPVPAIKAAMAADINIRLFINISSDLHCPADNGTRWMMFLRGEVLLQRKTRLHLQPGCN